VPDPTGIGQCLVIGCCVHGNELSGFHKKPGISLHAKQIYFFNKYLAQFIQSIVSLASWSEHELG
jgi:hypothetical protein